MGIGVVIQFRIKRRSSSGSIPHLAKTRSAHNFSIQQTVSLQEEALPEQNENRDEVGSYTCRHRHVSCHEYVSFHQNLQPNRALVHAPNDSAHTTRARTGYAANPTAAIRFLPAYMHTSWHLQLHEIPLAVILTFIDACHLL